MVKIISIVSGKGGCGKSLLTAVIGRALAREGERVLLIDTDIFVRGLTILLHSFKRKKTEDNLINFSDILGINKVNSKDIEPVKFKKEDLNLSRFFECDVLPAVDSISAPLDYDDRDLSDEKFCTNQLKKVLNIVGNSYDYIMLDNRAGMDSLILASCKISDFVISVAEDDPVGKQTNSNLVNHLKYNLKIKKVYTIINKGRNIKYYDDIISRSDIKSEFSEIGVIPFDIEILQDFGTDRFWNTVNETLYFIAVLDAWNNLSNFENIKELSKSKYRFPPKIFMNKTQGKYTLIERIIRIYSITFIFAGIFLWVYPRIISGKLTEFELFSIVSILVGVITLIISTTNLRKFIIGDFTKFFKDK